MSDALVKLSDLGILSPGAESGHYAVVVKAGAPAKRYALPSLVQLTIVQGTVTGTTFSHDALIGKVSGQFMGTVAGQSIYTTDLMSSFNTSTGTITFRDDQTDNRIELIII